MVLIPVPSAQLGRNGHVQAPRQIDQRGPALRLNRILRQRTFTAHLKSSSVAHRVFCPFNSRKSMSKYTLSGTLETGLNIRLALDGPTLNKRFLTQVQF